MRAIAFAFVLWACGSNDRYGGSAYAKVVDDRVEFELFGDSTATVTIPGLPPAPLTQLQSKRPSLPLDGLPDGDNEIAVKFEMAGEVRIVPVRFTKPAGAGKPFMRIADCGHPSGSSGTAHAKLDAGPFGKEEYCWLWSDGGIRIQVAASTGGKVTIGGVTADVKDGSAEVVYPARSLISNAPVRTAIGDGAGLATEVPITLAKGSEKLEGKLAIDVSGSAKDITRALFKDAAAGGLAAEKGDAPKRNRKSLVYVPADYGGPYHHGRATTVGEVGLVAIARDTTSRDGNACGPYASTKGAPNGGMAPRKLVDVEIDVFDAASGDKLGTKAFAADPNEECPMIAMSKGGVWDVIESRPSDKIVDRWLDAIVAKGALP